MKNALVALTNLNKYREAIAPLVSLDGMDISASEFRALHCLRETHQILLI